MLKSSSISPRAIFGLAFLTGVLLTCGLATWFFVDAKNKARNHFINLGEQFVEELHLSLSQPVYGLTGMRALLSAEPHLKRSQFHNYVAARDLPREFPGVNGFALVQRVPQAQVAQFVAAQRVEDSPQFTFRQLEELTHDVHYVVRFIEPYEKNAAALGLDVGSEPVRRASIEQAAKSGHATLSAPISLVQDQQTTPGVLLSVPLYAGGVVPDTVSARLENFIGVVNAPIVISQLINASKFVQDQRAVFAVRVSDVTNDDALWYAKDWQPDRVSTYAYATDVEVHGRSLRVHLQSALPFEQAQSFASTWVVLFGGLIITYVVSLLLYKKQHEHEREKRSFDTLRAQSERYAMLTRETSNAVIISDPQGLITWTNEGFERLTGYTAREALGQNPGKLLQCAATDKKQVAEIRHALQAQLPYVGEILNQNKNGTLYWVELRINPIYDEKNQLIGFVSLELDVTKRCLAEQAAKEKTELLYSAVNAMPDAFCLYSPDDRLIYFNEKYQELYHKTPEQLHKAELFESLIQAAADGGRFSEAMGRVDEWVAQRVLQHRSANGTFIQRLVTGQTVRVQERRTSAGFTVGIHTDITEQLTREVELRLAKQSAEDANLAKSQFLATMSHELRTPLNGVLGMAQLLARPAVSEKHRIEFARTIINSGNNLATLLSDLLDASQMEANKLQLRTEQCNVGALVQDVSLLFTQTAQQKGIEILAGWHGPAAQRYRVDAVRLRQMMSNLISNAIKFTSEGAVKIEAQELERSGGEAILEFVVQDSGVGIPQEKQHLLFKRFSQIENNAAHFSEGAGLGLSIVHGLAKRMGGDAGFESEEGQGSRFWFRIQVVVLDKGEEPELGEPEAQKAVVERPAVVVRSKDVAVRNQKPGYAEAVALVVEDNPINQKVIARFLSEMDMPALCVSNGQEAVHAIQRGMRPKVILMDVQMPVMNGWEATKLIRQWEKSHGISKTVIVGLTAGAADGDRGKCLGSGMDDVLFKPVDLDELELKIEGLLAESANAMEGVER